MVTAPGIRVEIPAGALTSDTVIAIRSLPAEATLGDNPVVSPLFALDPPGTTFARPVTVHIDVDRARVGAGPFDELDSVALMRRAGDGPWEVLGANDPGAMAAFGATDSFSNFAVVLVRASGCIDPRRLGGACINTTCAGSNEVCGQRCSVQVGGGTYRVIFATDTPGGTRVSCVCDNNGMQTALRALSTTALACDSDGQSVAEGEFRYDAAANQIHWRWNPTGYGFGETLQRQGTTAPDAGAPRPDVVDAGPPVCTFPMQRAIAVQGTEIPGTPSSCLNGGAIPAGIYTVTRYTDIYSTVRDYEYLRTWEVGAPRMGASRCSSGALRASSGVRPGRASSPDPSPRPRRPPRVARASGASGTATPDGPQGLRRDTQIPLVSWRIPLNIGDPRRAPRCWHGRCSRDHRNPHHKEHTP